MRASIKNYMDALKRRKSEGDEGGFSLIELIVVVVILGVLAAIAVPVFSGIQDNAETNALKTAAANGASVVAAQLANNGTIDLAKVTSDGVAFTSTGSSTLDGFCITAKKGTKTATSGPGCPA